MSRFAKVLTSLLLVIFFNIPNYLAYFNPPEGYVLAGSASLFDPWDTNVYLSVINWSQKFGFYYQNAYSTLSQNNPVIYPVYTTMGFLFLNVNSLFLYHTLNHLVLFIFIIILFKTVETFLPEKKLPQISIVVLICLAGGFGFFVNKYMFSPDLQLTPFTLKSSFYKPHMILSMTAELLIFITFFKNQPVLKPRMLVPPVLLTIFLAVINPLYLLGTYLITGLYSYYIHISQKTKTYLKHYFNYVAFSLPFALVWSFYILKSSSLDGVINQNLTSPNIFELFIGFGIFGILYLTQFKIFDFKKNDSKLIFLNIWFITELFLSLLPIGFSRYYLRLLFVPVVLISFKVLYINFSKITFKVLLLIFAIGSATNFLILAKEISLAKSSENWAYTKISEVDMFDFFVKNTTPESGVISANLKIGNLLPANTYNKIYLGHISQTPFFPEKLKSMKDYYSDASEGKINISFLKSNNIRYIIYEKKTLLLPFLTTQKKIVFENEDYIIVDIN